MCLTMEEIPPGKRKIWLLLPSYRFCLVLYNNMQNTFMFSAVEAVSPIIVVYYGINYLL